MIDSIHTNKSCLRSLVIFKSEVVLRPQSLKIATICYGYYINSLYGVWGGFVFCKTGTNIWLSQHSSVAVLIPSSPSHLPKHALFSSYQSLMNHWLIRWGPILFLQSPKIALQDERQRNLPDLKENSPFLFLQMKPQNL